MKKNYKVCVFGLDMWDTFISGVIKNLMYVDLISLL